MYTCPAKVVDFGDLIQYVDQDGATKTGRVNSITHYTPGADGVRYIDFCFDNGQKYCIKRNAQVTILEMYNPLKRHVITLITGNF